MSRTPGLPWFKKRMPSDSKAALIAASVDSRGSVSPDSTRASVRIGTPDRSASISRVQSSSPLAALMWAGFIGTFCVTFLLTTPVHYGTIDAMYKQLKFRLTGVSPLLMHNGRLANPLDVIAKEMKAVTGKRKKTDEDFKLLSDLEWLGSLYTTEDVAVKVSGREVAVSGGGRLCVPPELMEGLLIEASKKNRQRDLFKSGVLVEGPSVIEYSGPKSVADLFQKNGFRDIRRCKVKMSTIMRTRVIIRDWSVAATVSYLPSVLNERDIADTLTMAGSIIGLGDYRPKFGRFSVENA